MRYTKIGWGQLKGETHSTMLTGASFLYLVTTMPVIFLIAAMVVVSSQVIYVALGNTDVKDELRRLYPKV